MFEPTSFSDKKNIGALLGCAMGMSAVGTGFRPMDRNIDQIINSVGGHRSETSRTSEDSPCRLLRKWWIAETAAPVLLKYQEDLLRIVNEEIRRLRDYVETISLTLLDDSLTNANNHELASLGDVKLRMLLLETELERAKYTARAYLRTRLKKIDDFRYFYLQRQESLMQHGMPGLMSRDEWIYCYQHADLRTELVMSAFLNRFSEEYQDLAEMSDQAKMIDEPDFDKPVSFRALRSSVVTVGETPVEIVRNELYLMRFSAIMNILDDVELLI